MTTGSESDRVSSPYRSSTWRSLSNMASPQGAGQTAAAPRRGDGDDKLFGTRVWRGVWPALALPLGERLPLVLPLEALNATGSIQELLLARKERMALGAHLHPDLGLGRSGMNDLSAGTRDRRIDVFGMNASLHGPPPG